MGDKYQTPEFIRWAIAHSCPLRAYDCWQDPESSERHLRPLRAYADAIIEDRVFEGICIQRAARDIDPQVDDIASLHGFRVAEVLEVYGGTQLVEAACHDCPANVLARSQPCALAGCYGSIELGGLAAQFHHLVDKAVDEVGAGAMSRARFLVTRPKWYGLWASSPLKNEQISLIARVFQSCIAISSNLAARFRIFVEALETCRKTSTPLYVDLIPPGHVENKKWIVAAHCSCCKMISRDDDPFCRACGHRAPPNTPRVRNVRGRRPYWPLVSFMGEIAASALLRRYCRENARKPS